MDHAAGSYADRSALVVRLPDRRPVRPERPRGSRGRSGASWPARYRRGCDLARHRRSAEGCREGALVTAVAILMFYTLRPVVDWSETSLTYLSSFWVSRGTDRGRFPLADRPGGFLLCGFALCIFRRFGHVEGRQPILNVLAVIAVSMPIVQIATIKAPTATRATQRRRRWACSGAGRGAPAGHLLHHPRRLRPARCDEARTSTSTTPPSSSTSSARGTTSRGRARPITARLRSASPRPLMRRTWTSWSRGCGGPDGFAA